MFWPSKLSPRRVLKIGMKMSSSTLSVRPWPYRNLTRKEFDSVVKCSPRVLAPSAAGAAALIHHDGVNHRLRGRRGARLVALTSGGAIPDNADYRVILDPSETFVGTVNEDFAVESLAGDIFQLGNASWRILRINSGSRPCRRRKRPAAGNSILARRSSGAHIGVVAGRIRISDGNRTRDSLMGKIPLRMARPGNALPS